MFPDGFPPSDLDLQTDIPFSLYGLKLDLLQPRQRRPQPVPAVVHLHGGGWTMFSKWPVANVFLARAGFVTVSVDYRLAPQHVFPAQLHDAKTAVRWLRAHAEPLGIDPHRIGAWGISAGAHLAALLGTTAYQPELEGETGGWAGFSSEVQAVGNVCGPMDFFDSAWNFGDEPFELLGAPFSQRKDLAAQASPSTHVSGQAAPFIHLHGLQDDVAPISQARRMHAALKKVGVSSKLLELEGGHYINDTHQHEVEAHLLRFFERELAFTPSGA